MTCVARSLKPFGRWDLLIHQFRVMGVKVIAHDACFRYFSPTIPTVFFLVAKSLVGDVPEEHAHPVIYNYIKKRIIHKWIMKIRIFSYQVVPAALD